MPSDRRGSQAFAERWLREQQAYWQRFRAEGDAGGRATRARHAWDEACERWWQGVAETVPPPLAAQLKSALDQTRWWVSLAVTPQDADPASSPAAEALSPERLFAAAADAMRDAGDTSDPFDDPRYLAAVRTLTGLLLRIVQQALEHIRERVEAEQARSARDVHTIYSEEIESSYLRTAASDEFIRAVGELVNARVVMTPRRKSRDG